MDVDPEALAAMARLAEILADVRRVPEDAIAVDVTSGPAGQSGSSSPLVFHSE